MAYLDFRSAVIHLPDHWQEPRPFRDAEEAWPDWFKLGRSAPP